jgi:Txe/YoeB family toxin of Txe-Axe toxin-antitoxin module
MIIQNEYIKNKASYLLKEMQKLIEPLQENPFNIFCITMLENLQVKYTRLMKLNTYIFRNNY